MRESSQIVFEPVVLIVNVEPHFGAALARHLGERGWRARHVPRAREALAHCGEVRPRWVVTGFDDGDLDSLEFLAGLSAFPGRRPAVLVCAPLASLEVLGPQARRLLGIDAVRLRPCRFEAIEEALGTIAAAAEVERTASAS